MASNRFNDRLFYLRAAVAPFVFVLILLATGVDMTVAQECEGDPQALGLQCGRFIQKVGPRMDPSPGCCDAIKATDIACVCRYVPKEVQQMLDMEKVVYVVTFCGKPLPHGSKCGNYIVP